MNSSSRAAASWFLPLVGMPKPCESVIGTPAIEPLPNFGMTMKPTLSAPSFFCELGSAGPVLKHIDALPVSNSWMPW